MRIEKDTPKKGNRSVGSGQPYSESHFEILVDH